mgnify:CR=1 FL=1
MEEQELLDCLSEDVSLGIELAIRQYGKAVKTICQSILSGYSGEDIEEAISDTFVGLWRSREKIKLTDGQGLREYLYGIEADTTRSLEFRRACILSKLRGNGTATLEMMKNVAKSFCNSDVEIIEYNDEFRFEIKFDGTASAIENKDGFLKAIRELKPAHLQETLIEMTSLPSTLYVVTSIGSYKQEVVCNVNI